jgi:hypothetical protein
MKPPGAFIFPSKTLHEERINCASCTNPTAQQVKMGSGLLNQRRMMLIQCSRAIAGPEGFDETTSIEVSDSNTSLTQGQIVYRFYP